MRLATKYLYVICIGLIAIVSTTSAVHGQTTIETIDFESVNYTLNNAISIGGSPSTQFFDVFTASDEGTTHSLENGPVSGTQGNNYLAYRNNNTIGSRSLTNASSIDVTSYDNLELVFSLAATSGLNYEGDDNILIEYQFDGNGYQFLTQWAGNSSGNVLLSEDTDQTGGGDGVSATQLGTSFKSFTRSIPKTGQMLDIRFTVTTSIEDAVIDNIIVQGTTDATNPIANVTVSQDPIKVGNLTQTVTVTYDESMDSGTSPAISFGTSANFTSNGDGAWSTTTFANDTWTETFTHNGTSEEIAAEMVSVASASGATDLAGNTDNGDTSSSFVVDTDPPTATVTIDTDPIIAAALTQTVTVTYDQTMDNGTSPTISFGTSTNFNSNSDGAWSTTTFTDDTWTESFTHNGTNEQINNEVVTVASASGATDPNGNSDIGDASPSFVVDTKIPTTTVTISTAPININNLTQTVTVSYDEAMDPGTSPVITFTNSTNFTPNGDGAWSTTTFTNDTWTESFTHDGTAELITSETVSVAAASGAQDLVGQDESGDNSSGFRVDTQAPSATVATNTNPINNGNLTQTVTVTYDESMDNGTSPSITFGTSTNFSSNSDGAWSTTTFTDDTWTESFTHDGTPEEIAAETVSVASASGATDKGGNNDVGDDSPAFVVDTKSPAATVTVDTNPITTGSLTQTVIVTYDQTMDSGTSPTITFGTSTNFTSNSDGAWSTTTFTNDTWTGSFTHNGSIEQINNEVASVANNSGAADPNGNNDIGDDSPTFVVDTQAPTTTVTVAADPINLGSLIQTVTVTYDEAMNPATNPAITFGTSTKFVSNADGAWSTTTFSNDTWTESFTHNGTTEEIATETATVAAASGAQDLVGLDESGDSSPSFVIDTKAPTATATIDSNPINTGNLTQAVTVTYDESMDNGTSPTITFGTSGNFISNADGAWSTTSFTNDTWTESFIHNGTPEVIPSETISVASASGATDVAGNDDVGDSSPTFAVDTDAPIATVTVSANPINISNLIQTVKVTYDQTMDTGTSPAIAFGTSSNFTSNLDGAWSTTTFTNDTWIESFTHNGTNEQIAAEVASVINNSGATDPNGNGDVGDDSPAFVVDTNPPFLAPNEISLESTTSITFTLSEELNKSEGASLSGFSTSNGTILSVKYTGKGSTNKVTLTALLPAWNTSTTVSYSSGNVLDLAGNELQDFGPMPVTSNVVNLGAGDIAFTGYLGDDDKFSFVLLADMPAGTKIKFTDNGVLNDNSFTTAENTISWTTSTRLFAGTEVVISPGLTASTGTVAGVDLDFGVNGGGTDGDQVLAYQGTSANPTFLAALQMNGDWDSFTDNTNKEKSNVPPGLTDQVNAISINGESDNATYDFAAHGQTGNPTTLLNLINGNDNRWGKNNNPTNSAITFPTAGDNYIIPPDVISLSPANGSTAAGTTTSLQITFDQAIQKSVDNGANIILRKADNTLVGFWSINSSGVSIISGTTLSIDVSGITFEDGISYKVSLNEWSISDVAFGNHNTTIPFTDWTFSVDAKKPEVTSITRDPGVTVNVNNGTTLSTVSYIIVFSEDVNPSTVETTDFTTAGTASGAAEMVSNVSGSGDTYTITVNSIDQLGGLTINFTGTVDDLVGNTSNTVASGNESFIIINPEPSEYPSSLNAVPGSDNYTLDISWTPGAGAQLADGYLVYVKEPSKAFPADPSDLMAIPDDTDLSNGIAIVNTLANSVSVSGLNSAATYDVKIYPYTNSGNQIDYKVNGTAPETSGTTSAGSTGIIKYNAGPTASVIAATVNNQADVTTLDGNFVFTITDDGNSPGVDNSSTLINEITISQDASDEIVNWTEAIAGAQLSDGTNTMTVTAPSANITDTEITFTAIAYGDEELGEIDDDEAKQYTLKIWLKSDLTGSLNLPDIIDGLHFGFKLEGVDVSTINTNSGIESTQTAVSGANKNTVDVTATHFTFLTDPAAIEGVGVLLSSVPTIEVRDDNGNLDRTYSASNFALSVPTTFSSNDQFANGILTLSNFKYLYPGDGTITISQAGLLSDVSVPVDVIGTLYDTGINGVTESGPLTSGSVNRIILGFYLDAYSNTTNEPKFESIGIHFNEDVNNVFSNYRIFKAAEPLVTNPVLGTNATLIGSANFNPGLSTNNYIVLDGMSEILNPVGGDQNYYYIVADVSKSTWEGTPAVQPYFSSADVGLSSGSVNGGTVNGNTYTFDGSTKPTYQLSPAPGAINVPSNTILTVTFDEPVYMVDTVFSINRYVDDVEVAKIETLIGNTDSTIYTINPGSLADDTKYYISFSGNPNGFIDRSGSFANGISDKDGWSFTTADAVAPNFTDLTPSNLTANPIDEGFDIRAQLDEPGTVYYIITEGFPTTPPSTDKIFNPGLYTDIAKVMSGSFSVDEANKYFYKTIRGLNSSTSYEIYMVAEDVVPNKQMGTMQPDGGTIPLAVNITTSGTSSTQIIASSMVLCAGDYQRMTEPIHILEGSAGADNDDFGTSGTKTFEFVLPAGYEYDITKGDVDFISSSDISSVTLDYRNKSVLRITYNISGSSSRDEITVSNIFVKADLSAINGQITLSGSGTNGSLQFETIVSDLTISNIPTVEFTLNPSQSLYNYDDYLNNPIALITAEPTGTNLFSGPGVVNDSLRAEFAGLGKHEITLLYTDENQCQSEFSRTVDIVDETVAGLASSYCIDDYPNQDFIKIPRDYAIEYPDDLDNPRRDYYLISLTINTANADNPGNALSLTHPDPNWYFTPENALLNDTTSIDFDFVAIYENKINDSDKDTIIQRVNVYVPPKVGISMISQSQTEVDNNFCETFGDIIIQGLRPSGNLVYTDKFTVSKNGIDIPESLSSDDGNGNLTIDAQELANSPDGGYGTYTVRYSYKNSNTLCDAIADTTFTLNPKPIANFPSDIVGCIDTPLKLKNTSSISSGESLSFLWGFDDPDNVSTSNPNASTDSIPTHIYATTGTYNVNLIATSSKNCVSDLVMKALQIKDNPVPNYTFDQIGLGIPTSFDIDETQSLNVPLNKIDSAIWTFDERDGSPTTKSITSNIAEPYDFTFNTLGVKDVSLELITTSGCKTSISDSLFIVPFEKVTNNTNYSATFENNNTDGWMTWGTNNSWLVNSSGGDIITESKDPANNTSFWVTGAGTYNENQKSYVYSPIFDISGIESPLITTDIFEHLKPGDDGVVIEYSTTGYFGEWKVLGGLNSGVNWYETRDITNAAGNIINNSTNLGWSIADSTWREAKHSLSKVKEEGDTVQFRVSFESGFNPTSQTYNGFAFDNFLIGQRTRAVLLESFTNNNGPSIVANEANTLETEYTGDDVVKINYHTDFPTSETFNSANRIDPSARALYYNIDEIPRTVMDGIIYQDSPFSEWGENAFALRTLSLAQFDIQFNVSTQDGAVNIATDITPTLPTSGNNVIVTAAVLESTTDHENILRKLLPNAAGIKVNAADITVGQALPAINFSWVPNNVTDLNNLSVVVFVQDEMTKEVYQAVIDHAIPTPDQVTGFGDDLANTGVTLYPNPANGQLTVTLSQSNSSNRIQIYDSFGKLVYYKDIDSNDQTLTINTSTYASGLYQVQLIGKDMEPITKRLMIVHR